MPQRSHYIAAGIIIIVTGLIAIAYNFYILSNPSSTLLGTKYAYFALGMIIIAVGVFYTVNGLQKIDIAHQHDLPRIGNINDSEALPDLSSEQLYIMQQLFKHEYGILIKSLEGGFNNLGVFHVIRKAPNGRLIQPGVVVKFLNYRDILKEKSVYQREGVLKKYNLPYTPGQPIKNWPPDEQLTDSNRRGAVCYELATLNHDSELHTLKNLYKQYSFDEFSPYLKLLYKKLERWHTLRLPEATGPRLGGPDGLYERLYRRRRDIQNGIHELTEVSGNLNDPSSETISFPFLSEKWENERFYNPIHWINYVLVPGEATCFTSVSSYSPVHGDLHTSNVLIEKGRDTHLWLIDFPNSHIGPSLQDFTTMEADVKFNLIDMEQCSLDEWLEFEQRLLAPLRNRRFHTLTSPWSQRWQPENEELLKAWQFIEFLRDWVIDQDLIGVDVRTYYLALLHSTLPSVYRSTQTRAQKEAALISSAWICEHLT